MTQRITRALILIGVLSSYALHGQTPGTGNYTGPWLTFGTGINTATTTGTDKIAVPGDFVAIQIDSDGTLDDKPIILAGGFAPEGTNPRFDFGGIPGVLGLPIDNGTFFFLINGIFTSNLAATIGPGSGTIASVVLQDPGFSPNDAIYLQAAVQSSLFPFGFGLTPALEVDIDPVSCLPGAVVLPLGDDDAMQVNLGFPFLFYGTSYTSVWVGSNGVLDFGGSNVNATPTGVDVFMGTPKIGVLWDDLDPTAGGTISAYSSSNRFEACWSEVPEKGTGAVSTFKAVLTGAGIACQYRFDSQATNGIICTTPGLGAALEGESNMSGAGTIAPSEGFLQIFNGTTVPFDMAGLTLIIFNDTNGHPFFRVAAPL